MIERERAEELSVCITHTAAVSCAATHVPEIKLASHSLRKTGFRNAVKVDSLLEPLLIRIAKLNTEPAGFIPISVSPAAFSESTAGNACRRRAGNNRGRKSVSNDETIQLTTNETKSFSFNGSLTNNRCPGFFVDEIRQATLLALVFSIAVLLTTGCSSTGDGFSAKFIAPVTSSAKGLAPS
jgi:hypothetical protein